MAYIWDPAKAADNIREHKVTFETASLVFDDPFRIKRRDDDSSETEERYQTIGLIEDILFVVYTELDNDDIRIISARVAEPFERRLYHEFSEVHSQGWERADY